MGRTALRTVLVSMLVILATSGCEKDENAAGPLPDSPSSDIDTMDSDRGGDGDTSGSGDTDVDSDSDADTDADADADDGWNTDDDVCGKEDFEIDAAPARVMILQDMSGSMLEGTPSKWEQTEQALTTMLNNFGDQLEIGFDAFPRNNACGVGAKVLSDSQSNNASVIIDEFPNLEPNGSTPLLAAMKKLLNVTNAPSFLSQDATSYLIIVSDGDDTCAGGLFATGATANQLGTATTDLLDQMGVRTYIIGFGDGASPEKLDAIAGAGGTGQTTFINAMDKKELTDALNQIGSSVVSCVYDLGEQTDINVNLNEANFYFDDDVIGWDDGCANGNGWQWANGEQTRVEFCPGACSKLQTGAVSNISVTFGCERVIVE